MNNDNNITMVMNMPPKCLCVMYIKQENEFTVILKTLGILSNLSGFKFLFLMENSCSYSKIIATYYFHGGLAVIEILERIDIHLDFI